ncbi:MAG: ABC transporter substrate-binding protein [Symploca sp. SIO3E6]|nr:ABC transporter substrate-binding protein [Caldora sp. SIO3E6]
MLSKLRSLRPLNRRTMIYGAIATSTAIATGCGKDKTESTPKQQPSVEWTMVSFLKEDAKDLILYQAPQMVCDLIKQMSDGEFTITLDNSENIATEDILKKVSDGDVQCGYSGIYYNDATYKVLFFGSAVPFGLTPQEQNAWLLYKKNPNDKLTFMQGIYKELDLNVIPFPAGGTGAQMGGWFNKEVKSPNGFNDLVMRIPGLGAEVLRDYFGVKLDENLPGGSIPITQIKNAFKEGKIKAAEWIGPYDDLQLGLHEVAEYYYYPGWWEPSTTFDVQVNIAAWDKLSSKYQEIFKAACFETHTRILAEYDQKNSEKLGEILYLETSGQIKVRKFDNSIIKQAKESTNSLLAGYAQDKTFKKVYEEWFDFKERIRKWSDLSIM